MKFIDYIKIIVLIGVTGFLFGFANLRNEQRISDEIDINFTNGNNLFVTEEVVNKMLIQNKADLENKVREPLVLNRLEQALDDHEMIKASDVYLSIDGKLGAILTQRQPIARVMDRSAYYIDDEGLVMPLSNYHSARVVTISGINEKEAKESFPLLKRIDEDPFLKKTITHITKRTHGGYIFSLRTLDMQVAFGALTDLDKKINNFKAFYKKAQKDDQLNTYALADLQFGNQVVCTKK
ncbi:cell division protein FtsQ [Gangjinia marincola]|uniref:Cell division protein FtsQ n=1 Tax=Gangjinia marincola TaxID=578463 RepID=A0ABP3XVH0_9FLAO